MKRRLLILAVSLGLPPAAGVAPAAADGYASMAKTLAKNLKKLPGKKVAVVPFSYADGRRSPGGRLVADLLETELVKRSGPALVERTNMDKILDEIKLEQTGLVMPESALKAGRLAGADILITGTLMDAGGDRLDVHSRLIRLDTGEVLAAAKARVRRGWADDSAGEPAAAALPASSSLRLTLLSAAAPGTTRRVAGRDLALRCCDQGDSPAVRITDYTDRGHAASIELPLRFAPDLRRYQSFSKNFRLASRKYRGWADSDANFHLAPRGSLWRDFFVSDAIREHEVIVPFNDLLRNWADDIRLNSRALVDAEQGKLVAYAEPLKGLDVRVSVLRAQTSNVEEPGYLPVAVAVLKGRRDKTVASAPLQADSNHFRFRYNAGTGEISVESLQQAPPPPQPASEPAEPLPPQPSADKVVAAPRSPIWWVQVGSFLQKERAEKAAQDLRSAGRSVAVVPFKSAGALYHKVRVGPFMQRFEAEAAAQQLSAQKYPALLIKK